MEEKKYTLQDLKDAWDASDNWREEIERIGCGRSNFTKSTYPNREEYFKNLK